MALFRFFQLTLEAVDGRLLFVVAAAAGGNGGQAEHHDERGHLETHAVSMRGVRRTLNVNSGGLAQPIHVPWNVIGT